MAVDELAKTGLYKPDDSSAVEDFLITVFDAGAAPQKIRLSAYHKDTVTFGRGEENDINLQSRYVSRERHGCFRRHNERWCIENAGSLNGITYQGQSIHSFFLHDGDMFRIDDSLETSAEGVLFIVACTNTEINWQHLKLGTRRTVNIGREPACEIQLNHVSVSKRHAEIIQRDGQYWLRDNNSTNGTYLNGSRIQGAVRLHEKDVILVTNSKLVFTGGMIAYCCFNKGIRLEAFDIVKKVTKKQKVICNDVSLTINPCELVAIIGGSGAGKSTIMNCISGYNAPTTGSVFLNGVDLYANYDAMKSIIGYVPQSDIVYDNLTVRDMLNYTALLRLPKDTSADERRQIIDRVIATVDLTERSDTLIKSLSGGQRKRASIAVELISDPNLFFLDEPASGLDPGTERSLMKTLKNMAKGGKTVILVTHSTLQLKLCDKIVFMGKGGNLCFFGSHDEALRFFGVEDLVDVYSMITDESEKWKTKYEQQCRHFEKRPVQSERTVSSKNRHNPFLQLGVLCVRYLHLLRNDKTRMILLLALAPVLTFLISMVADGQQFEQFEMTQSLLFSLSCCAYFLGTLNSIQEVCKERNILRREYMTGLKLRAYVVSKIFVLGIICAVQSLQASILFVVLIGCPDEGVMLPAFLEILLTTFLTAFASSAIGIFVSSLFTNADRAMTVAPLLLMPQLLFAGLIFKLDGATEIISWFAACRWSMESYGTTANLNTMELKLQQQGIPVEHVADDFFEYSSAHILTDWLILLAFVVVFAIAAGIVLTGIKKERK